MATHPLTLGSVKALPVRRGCGRDFHTDDFCVMMSSMLYSTILADPPWRELGGGKIKRGADKHYPVMKTEDIMALRVGELALPNSHLYLWVTNSHLPDGFRVMSAWNFRYITCITWGKDRMGLGQYFRGQTEHVLFGVRGNIPYRKLSDGKRAQGKTLLMAKRRTHSEKPEGLRAMVERVSPGPYLELFARKSAPGWHTWGNEISKDVELDNFSPIITDVDAFGNPRM